MKIEFAALRGNGYEWGTSGRSMGDFEVTFLGTATSVGVPMIGCDCEVCRSEDPKDKRTRSSIHVWTPETAFVIDTGPDFRAQCLRERITELNAALYTHAHVDHMTGFDDLRRFCLGADAGIDVYARPSTLADLRRMFTYAFSGEHRHRGYVKPTPHAVAGPFALGATLVTPLPVEHGNVETVGYLFTRDGAARLAYIPDCKRLGKTTREAIRGVGTLVIDALRFSPHPTHMNFDEALEVVADVRPGRAYFTHFMCEVMHARDDAGLPSGVRLSYDGLRIDC